MWALWFFALSLAITVLAIDWWLMRRLKAHVAELAKLYPDQCIRCVIERRACDITGLEPAEIRTFTPHTCKRP